jgi:hypothetical protein
MGKMKYASEVSQHLCDDSHDPPPSQPAVVRAWIDCRANGSLGWGESCRMTQDTADGLEVLSTVYVNTIVRQLGSCELRSVVIHTIVVDS